MTFILLPDLAVFDFNYNVRTERGTNRFCRQNLHYINLYIYFVAKICIASTCISNMVLIFGLMVKDEPMAHTFFSLLKVATFFGCVVSNR